MTLHFLDIVMIIVAGVASNFITLFLWALFEAKSHGQPL